MSIKATAIKPTPRTDETVKFIKNQLSADACDRDHPYYVIDVMAITSRQLENDLDTLKEGLAKRVADLEDILNNGVKYDAKRNMYYLVWTERQLAESRRRAEELTEKLRALLV